MLLRIEAMSNPNTIDEYKARKRDMERAILDAIRDFEFMTGLHVDSIETTKESVFMGASRTVAAQCKIEM